MANITIKVQFNGPALDEDTLKNAFKGFGKVKKCRILDWGGAFVEMKDEQEGKAAVESLNGKTISGCQLKVSVHEKAPPKPAAVPGSEVPAQTAPNDKFVNPYNFIPVKTVHKDAIKPFLQEGNHWHEQFRGNEYSSGRVVCEIEAESEIFIGAGVMIPPNKDTETPAKVAPYELGGEPAIPPTSLKGMISSLMEAASNSALRVLAKSVYTRRADFNKEMLSDIGLVQLSAHAVGKPHLYIVPIKKGLPVKAIPNRTVIDLSYPVYLDGYNRHTNKITGLLSGLMKDFSADSSFYYIRLSDLEPKVKGPFFLGYKLKSGSVSPIITKDEYDKKNSTEKSGYREGIYKILGIEERWEEMPETKKHEFFLFTDGKIETTNMIPLPDDVISSFNDLSDDRSSVNKSSDPVKMRLPFSPFGRQRQSHKEIDALRVRENDVVYYKNMGGAITKLSFSACWREFCGNTRKDNDAYGYFRQVDKNGFLLPPGLMNQKKDKPEDLKLTSVSALLGFVEEEKHKDLPMALALAGRLFISPGILSPGQNASSAYGEEKTLKILDSPKMPCPEFYFYKNGSPGSYTTKMELKPDGNFLPNGRKDYWRHKNEQDQYASADYAKKHYKQCLTITPVTKGTKFLFCIDFYNLSEFELGMLLYALRPGETFRHLIGLGKPIGLGSIKIDVLNLLFVERKKRYSDDALFDSSFFHTQTNHMPERVSDLAREFTNAADERCTFDNTRFCAGALANSAKSVESFIKTFTDKMKEWYKEDWFTALERMGNPASTEGLLVRYPPDPGNPAGFDEAYKWWMRNAGKDKEDKLVDGKWKKVPMTGLKKALPPARANDIALCVDPRQT